MATILIAILFSLALCGVALWANARFRSHDSLPMQWWLTGEVTWSAPRPIALAFIPALAIFILASLAVLSVYTDPRPGQEGMEIAADLAIGIALLAGQLFHLWMVEQTVRRKGR